MKTVIETLFLRRPKLDYTSPPVCEVLFSSTGHPIIVLNPLSRNLGPTGLIVGGRGRVRLRWNAYPGALCYNVYRGELDANIDTCGCTDVFNILAECIQFPDFQLPSFGCYLVSAITADGESELSDPICFGPQDNPCPDGTTWMPELMACACPPPPFCPDGESWDGINCVCVPCPEQSCPDGFHWDASACLCVPNGGGGCEAFIDPLDDLIECQDLKSNGIFIGTVNDGGLPRPWVYSNRIFQDASDFGTLGGTQGFGRTSNSAGIFAGLEYTPGDVDLDVFWLRMSPPEIRNITSDIGLTPGASDVVEMNENGFVLLNTTELYDPAGSAVSLTGVGNSQVGSVNNSQVVAGHDQSGTGSVTKACFWVPGSPASPTYIHPPRSGASGTDASGVFSRKSINASGHIVGAADDGVASIGPQPFFYNGSSASLLPGFLDTDIADSLHLFVNDSDVIAGTKNKDEPSFTGVPFMWDSVNGTVLLPLASGATYGWVFGLNNSGIIVGSSDVGGWLYRNGATYRVIDLIPSGQGWDSIDTVNFITNDNYIAGFGVQNGVSKGYVCKLCF